MARSGGKRRDSTIATQRRLDLVRRLLRGPATADSLIAAVRAALGDDIYPAEARVALRHDLAALHDTFGCTFVFRTGEGYFLTALGTLTLLDLDTEELDALALLWSAVDDGAVPRTPQLARLRARVLALMPEHIRAHVSTIVPRPRLDLPTQPTGAVSSLIERLRPALGRCEVTFQYRSPYTADDTREQHRVAPYELFQRDGLTYLDAYCLASSITKLHGRSISYRLDRMVATSLRRLPTQLPPVRYARQVYRLRYVLASTVAGRRDIALWFPGSTCSYTDAGTATVEAGITDLWYARNVLLRYREHCRVLEPPELVAMMRDSITRMQTLYDDEGAGV